MSPDKGKPGHLSLSERLLLLLSRKPGTEEPVEDTEASEQDDALSQLYRAFPDFSSLIEGKDVLDFGCGEGLQVLALAQQGARFVLGLDSNSKTLRKARERAQCSRVAERVAFAESLSGDSRRFDIVISQNSMEHFPDPASVLEQMKRALNPSGKVLITFGPPWFAPYGSHMRFFTRVPWLNLLFSEKAVMKVRERFRRDGASRYEDVESGLNRMTVGCFERTISAAGLQAERRRYRAVRGIAPLTKLPLVRELFVNQIDCVLVPRTESRSSMLGSDGRVDILGQHSRGSAEPLLFLRRLMGGPLDSDPCPRGRLFWGGRHWLGKRH